MSDETVVETDGVTVSKFFNADDFPVPAVAFEVSSSLEESAEFAIVDEIPDGFGIDQIGFHPEYGSEHWTATGDGIVRFEREVDAGESFTTVYGVRMDEGQDETPFLSAPTIEVAGEDIDDVVPPESTSVVRELAGGERDTVPGLEDDDATEADLDADDVAALEGDDAEILGSAEEKLGVSADAGEEGDSVASGDETTAESASDAGVDDDSPETGFDDDSPDLGFDETDSEEADASETPSFDADDSAVVTDSADHADSAADSTSVTESDPVDDDVAADSESGTAAAASFDASDIVGAVADAVREDRVSDDDLETLQEAFGGVPKSTQTEIEHLQSRVSEMESYTDALEAFIDENGTAQNVLADFESDLESIERDIGALQTDVADVESDVETVEAGVSEADEERAALESRVEELDDGLGVVDDLREDVERLSGDLDALDERVADAEDLSMDVDDLESDVEEIEDDIEAMEEWRDQLSDVFGA